MMIDTIAKRRTTLNGKTYEKGDTATMPLAQFESLEPIARFARKRAAKSAAIVSPTSRRPKRPTDPRLPSPAIPTPGKRRAFPDGEFR